MKARTLIIGLACLLACSVSVSASGGKKDAPGIEGRFADQDGTLLGYVQVSLYDSRQTLVRSTRTAVDGTFRFSGLQPGVYYIRCRRNGEPEVWYGGISKEPVVVGSSSVNVEIVALR